MDKLIFGLLQEEINYIFKDFKAEDLNTNFLKGDLELQNLELNVAAIQDLLATIVPFVQIEKAIVRKLRVKVPLSAPKAKATEIWISKIDIIAKEPQDYQQVLAAQQANTVPKKPPPKKTGKFNYGLGDRIMDGLKLKVEHIHISFALLGRFRHAEPGLWTPHLADVNIYDLEMYSTNEKFEVPLEHADTRAYTHGKSHVWVFKEAVCKVSVRLIPFRGTKNTQGVTREPITLFDKIPVKAQITIKRLNADEKVGIEATVFLNQIKIELASKQVGYFAQWVEAVIAAATRQDLKAVMPQDVNIADMVPDMNVLVNLVCDNAEIVLVEEKTGGQKIPAISLQAKGLITNLWSSLAAGGPGAKFVFSNVFVQDLKQEQTLMKLYHAKNPSNADFDLPIPADVLIHPEPRKAPQDLHGCLRVMAKIPPPPAPTPVLNIEIKADSCEMVIDRATAEFLAIFVMGALIVNHDIPAPQLSDYKNPKDAESEKAKITPGIEQVGAEYIDIDLLAGSDVSFALSAQSNEFRALLTTPGGADVPYLEFFLANASVVGSPVDQPIAYSPSLLALKTQSGAGIVQPHDFFFQKFNGAVAKEDKATKFSGHTSQLAINFYPKKGAQPEHIVAINKLKAEMKIYSLAKYVPSPTTIPQIECNLSVSEVAATLHQHQHLALIKFLEAHFLYSAASDLKSMLETEVKKLAFVDPAVQQANQFLIAVVTGDMKVSVIDINNKPIINALSKGAEAVIENHPSKGIVFGRLDDLRVWALPELEQSLLWVNKTRMDHFLHSRTEWRTWGKKSPYAYGGPPTLFVLADIDGLNLNLNMASVYHCLDYLVSVLGESILLGEKTEHSFFFWKVMSYAKILFLTGIQDDTFDYWMALREAQEVADQLAEALLDLFWDVSFANFNVILGDDKTHIKPFSFKNLQIASSKEEALKTWNLSLKGLQGSIAQLVDGKIATEEPFSVPFDFIIDYKNRPNPEWKADSPATVFQTLQNVEIKTEPAVSVFITPEHFRMMASFINAHIQTVKQTVDKLVEEIKKKESTDSAIVVDENVIDEVKGLQSKLNSPASAFALKKELDAANQRLQDNDTIQIELITRNAELQSSQAQLESKLAAALKEIQSYQTAMEELQAKLIHLQLGAL